MCRAPVRTGRSGCWPARAGAARPPASRARRRRGRARRGPPAISTPPERITRAGSTTATMAESPSAKRWAELGEQLVAGAGPGERGGDGRRRGGRADARRSGPARAPAGPPASSWKAPALPRRTSRTSGVPGSGRKPTSPAPPVAPPSQPTVDHDGGTEPLVGPQQDEVVDTAGDARRELGDGGEVHVVVDVDRDADLVGEPLEQVGVVPPGEVAGVAEPPRRAGRRRRACRSRGGGGRTRGARRRSRHPPGPVRRGSPRRAVGAVGCAARTRRRCGR